MAGVIDYAGLFPPASLSMADAVANFDGYRRGPDAWALGRFVVSAGRLEELAGAAAPRLARSADAPTVWRVSAVVGAELAADVSRIDAFNTRMATTSGVPAMVDAVELKAQRIEEIVELGVALPAGMETYVEIPLADDPAPLVGAIRRAGLRAKARTGGVTAESFPAAAELVRFLAACIDAGVPFKATAGLHHAVRAEYRLTYAPESPTGTMYGFLNVFLAAALLRAGASSADAVAALEETDPRALAFEDGGVSWRSRWISADELATLRRDGLIAFGSCSFEEPLADLRALALV
jgi:hypothetical protein